MARIAYWMFVLGLLLPAVLVFGEQAVAAHVIVGPGGFATIQQAVNSARPGDVVSIAPGVYNESVDLSLMGSAVGASSGNLSLVAANGPLSVTIGGIGSKLRSSAAFNGTLILDGLTLSSSDSSAISLSGFGGLVVLNCRFRTIGDGVDDNAIELASSGGTPNVVVYDTSFSLGADTGTAIGAVLDLRATAASAPSVVLQNLTSTEIGPRIGSPDRLSLFFDGAGGGVTVRDSTLTNSPGGGIVVGFATAGAGDLSIVNNTLSTLEVAGVTLIQQQTRLDATIAGNDIADPGEDAIFVSHDGQLTGRVYQNQICSPNGRGVNLQTSGTSTARDVVEVVGNFVCGSGQSSLWSTTAGSGGLDLTITDNFVLQPNISDTPDEAGVVVSAGGSSALRLALEGNFVLDDPSNRAIRLAREPAAPFELAGVAGQTPQQNVVALNSVDPDGVTADEAIAIIAQNAVPRPARDNGPPLAGADTAGAVSGTPATIDVLANDTAPNAPLSLRFVVPIGRRGGAAAASGNSLSYTSPPGFVGSDTLYYVAADARGATVVGQVSVNVTPPPTATAIPLITPSPTQPQPTPTPVVPTVYRRWLPPITRGVAP